MAAAPKPKTSAAFAKLAETLGEKPPKALDKLPARDLQHLNKQIEEALSVHLQAIEDAENSIVNTAPRALRGTVRKVLGV